MKKLSTIAFSKPMTSVEAPWKAETMNISIIFSVPISRYAEVKQI